MTPLPQALARHLSRELGAWPPPAPFAVTTSPARSHPGWDGRVRPVVGVATPAATLVAVDAARFDAARAAASLDDLSEALDGRIVRAVFRWAERSAGEDRFGSWVSSEDARLPAWLRPFGGDVLVAFGEGGDYLAGVGFKRHDDDVWEIAVGTEERARGLGLARRLVRTAAAAVLAGGRTPTYLHDPSNLASARVAEAAGFPDRGWSMLFLAAGTG